MIDHVDREAGAGLLRRLQQNPTNQAAWNEFVDRYGRLIFSWCRHWGLQPADAEDVTQNVLLELAQQIKSFVYDPAGSFPAWLRTIAYRSWCRFIAERRRKGASPDFDRLMSLAAGEDFLHQLEREGERELLDQAMLRVRRRVAPRTWEVFRLTALEQRSGAEVAEQFHMKVATVFVARSKVQKLLREELQRLEGYRFG